MEASTAHNVFASVRDRAAIDITQGSVHCITPTVNVIDGDVAAREALERVIRAAGWRPESFASAEEFLAQPHSALPCCVILDLALPGLSGLELQERLAERPDMPIIVVTSHTDIAMIVQAMKAGAIELLPKPVRDVALRIAIRTAIERSHAALRHDSEMQTLGRCYAILTSREREVMALVVSGLLNKQVGGELGISETTVKAHRGSVMRKMQAASFAELVNMARRLELRPRSYTGAIDTPLYGYGKSLEEFFSARAYEGRSP